MSSPTARGKHTLLFLAAPPFDESVIFGFQANWKDGLWAWKVDRHLFVVMLEFDATAHEKRDAFNV